MKARLVAVQTVVCVMTLVAGCTMIDPRSARSLDANTARRIAAVVEDVVAGRTAADSLPESVDGVTIGLPDVMTAVESRRARFEACARYKAVQCIGENKRGLAHYRKCDACEERQVRNQVLMLIDSENVDRWAIYESIVKGNRLPSSARRTLQEAFRAEHEARALSGELYQTQDGDWMYKP